MLEREVLPWKQSLETKEKQKFVFQQDSAPAHGSKVAQAWCSSKFSGFITRNEWPPSSPDLNMIELVWGIVQSRACAVPHASLESLINALQREWDKLDQATINGLVEEFPERLEKCIKANGGFFE